MGFCVLLISKQFQRNLKIYFKFLGLIPWAIFLGKMQKISREINVRMQMTTNKVSPEKSRSSVDESFSSSVSRSSVYSLQKRKKYRNLMQSLISAHIHI